MRFSLWGGEDTSQTDPETKNPFSFIPSSVHSAPLHSWNKCTPWHQTPPVPPPQYA